MAKQYSMYRRSTGEKATYYVRFRDPETGERVSGISTCSTKKAEAENFAISMIKSGKMAARKYNRYRNHYETTKYEYC